MIYNLIIFNQILKYKKINNKLQLTIVISIKKMKPYLTVKGKLHLLIIILVQLLIMTLVKI